MLRNFFLTTLRSLRKNPLYSFVNIAGLAIGIACSLLILLWVNREMSYDKFHPEYDQLFQVWMHAEYTEEISSWRSVPLPLYLTLPDVDPAIEQVTVSDWGEDHLLTTGDKKIRQHGYYVGKEFLSMFPFRTANGQRPADLLRDPSSIVLTRSAAKAIFGDADPVGKDLQVDNESTVTVTGILDDLPDNSSFEFDFLIPWQHYEQNSSWVRENTDNWSNYSFQIYVKLNSAKSREKVENSLVNLLEENGETDAKRELFLLPLEDWRLKSSFENGRQAGGLIVYVRMFGAVAILILVIACINFMNLATARAERRAREVGVRKTLGSSRGQLIRQFLGESMLLACVAYLVAILLTELALPYYNSLLNNKLSIDYASPEFWLITLAVVFVAGLLSGSFPAFYLSSFQPVRTLKGAVFTGRNKGLSRKLLVGLQFVLSIFLLASTVVIYRQIELVRARDLGYGTENLIMLQYTDLMHENYSPMKQELLNSSAVQEVTKSNSPVTSVNSNNFLEWPGKSPDQNILFATLATEYDFTSTLGVTVLEGRDFSRDFPSDSMSILVNEAAIEQMRLENPLGTRLTVWDEPYTLIGVIDNILTGSVFRETQPMFVIFDPDWAEVMTIRLSDDLPLNQSLAEVEKVVNKYNAAYPFEYEFVDDVFEKKFNAINLTQKLAATFALLAIFITGMGLYGLATYLARRRIREMGIRKVMGASIRDLLILVNEEFMLIVVIALAISAPLTWWALSRFLSQFDIRTSIPWWVFLSAGLVLLLFTVLIVSFQVYKAASMNPTDSLREE